MAADLEPNVIWWHKGHVQVASEIVKKLRTLYAGSEAGKLFDEIFFKMNAADAEMTKMANDKNEQLWREFRMIKEDASDR